jgi:ribosomal protein L34E
MMIQLQVIPGRSVKADAACGLLLALADATQPCCLSQSSRHARQSDLPIYWGPTLRAGKPGRLCRLVVMAQLHRKRQRCNCMLCEDQISRCAAMMNGKYFKLNRSEKGPSRPCGDHHFPRCSEQRLTCGCTFTV